jgi:hypothetical protein
MAEGDVPGVVSVSVAKFRANRGEALEKELADVGQGDGVAARDAVLSNEPEEFAEHVVDVAGGSKLSGG